VCVVVEKGFSAMTYCMRVTYAPPTSFASELAATRVVHMKIKKYPPPERGWHRRAACRDFDPAMWDLDGEKVDHPIAQEICNSACPVRRDCLLDALTTLHQTDLGPRSDVGVIRGGIRMREGWKSRSICLMCTLYVCNSDTPSICYSCRKYRPCGGGCGRGVWRRSSAKYCETCEKEMAERGELAA